jgi:hypothetical protein
MSWKRGGKWDFFRDFAGIFWGAKRNLSFVFSAELGSFGKRMVFSLAEERSGLGAIVNRATAVELGGYRCGELHTMPV